MIYTKKGDGGKTRLVTGEWVDKTHPDIMLTGDFDELSCVIGLLLSLIPEDLLPDLQKETEVLLAAQRILFRMGTLTLAQGIDPTNEKTVKQLPAPEEIRALETGIDRMESELHGLFRGFILPGGNVAAAQAHVARTVCRRVEREYFRLAFGHGEFTPQIGSYMNRLSDFLYALARKINSLSGIDEKKAY